MFVGLSAHFSIQNRRLPQSSGFLPWRSLAVRNSGGLDAAPAPRAIVVEPMAPSATQRSGLGRDAAKSLSRNELRSLPAPQGVLPMPALLVPKERAVWQFAVLVRRLRTRSYSRKSQEGQNAQVYANGQFLEFSRRAENESNRLDSQGDSQEYSVQYATRTSTG
jgi:hypothetical protein